MHALSCILILCVENCVAAIGAMRFSVRSFGCALFYFVGGSMDKEMIIKWSIRADAIILGIFAYKLGDYYELSEYRMARIMALFFAIIGIASIVLTFTRVVRKSWIKADIVGQIVMSVVEIAVYLIADEEFLIEHLVYHYEDLYYVAMVEILIEGGLWLGICGLLSILLYMVEE